MIGFAEHRPRHHAGRHLRRGDLRVHRGRAYQRRGAEGEEPERFVDLAFVLLVHFLPFHIARFGHKGEVLWRAVRIGHILQPHIEILRVVAAPIESFCAAKPFVLRTSVQLRAISAQLEHGDLVRARVADQPFVGVKTVVARRKQFHYFADTIAILDGLPGAIRDGRPFHVERALADGGLRKHHAGIVLIPVCAALDAAGIALHKYAMPLGRLDVQHDIGLFGEREGPHRNVADHHLAVARGLAGGCEGAAPRGNRHPALRSVVARAFEIQPFQAAWGHRHGGLQLAQLRDGVGGDDVHKVHRPAAPLRARGRGSLGDALHLLQDFFVKAAKKKRVRGGAAIAPGGGFRLRIELRSAAI